jgi:hypothetical protein
MDSEIATEMLLSDLDVIADQYVGRIYVGDMLGAFGMVMSNIARANTNTRNEALELIETHCEAMKLVVINSNLWD